MAVVAQGKSAGAHGRPAKGPTPLRTVITIGTMAASFVGITSKVRKANGSTDVIDHVDLIASITAFVVLAVRARRERTSASDRMTA